MAERNSRSSRPRKRSGTVRSAPGAAEGTRIAAGAGELPAGAATDTGAGTSDPALGADPEAGAEPIVLAERITVIAEVPLGADYEAAAGPGADAQSTADGTPVTAERRWLMIAERAYARARDRGFEPGRDLEDWLVAEQEVDALLGERGRTRPEV